MTERVCSYCDKPFMAQAYDVERGFGRFCSLICLGNDKRRRPHKGRYLSITDQLIRWPAFLAESLGIARCSGRKSAQVSIHATGADDSSYGGLAAGAVTRSCRTTSMGTG
jgi:hypothetical protein